VELKDYGSFPSHTIFINVESKQQVQNLSKELRPAQQLMALNKDNKPHFINDPHLTIARKLLPGNTKKAGLITAAGILQVVLLQMICCY
jgi:2'-5' RNA ligase